MVLKVKNLFKTSQLISGTDMEGEDFYCELISEPAEKRKTFERIKGFFVLCPEQESNLHSLAKTRF